MAAPLPEIIAEKIRSYRLLRGISQKQLAEMLGLDQSHLSRIEAGKIHPSLELVERLGQALEVPVWVLLQADRTDDLSVREKLYRLEELAPDKQQVILLMLDAFLREQELNALRHASEVQTLRELRELREKKSGK